MMKTPLQTRAGRSRHSGAAESRAITRRSARSMPKAQARPRTDAGPCPTAPCNSTVVACTFWHNLQPCTEQDTVHSQPARQRRPPASALRLLGLRHLQLGARLGQGCRVSGRHHRVQGFFAQGRGLWESSCHGSIRLADHRRRVKCFGCRFRAVAQGSRRGAESTATHAPKAFALDAKGLEQTETEQQCPVACTSKPSCRPHTGSAQGKYLGFSFETITIPSSGTGHAWGAPAAHCRPGPPAVGPCAAQGPAPLQAGVSAWLRATDAGLPTAPPLQDCAHIRAACMLLSAPGFARTVHVTLPQQRPSPV